MSWWLLLFEQDFPLQTGAEYSRDVNLGATGATAVAPKFSDALTLFQPGGADSAPTTEWVAPKISPRLHLCDLYSMTLVLIGVEYKNCRRTLDVYLLFTKAKLLLEPKFFIIIFTYLK